MASLAQTNKHLATAAQRRNAVRVTVATSSAIEGIHAPFKPGTAPAKATPDSRAKGATRKVRLNSERNTEEQQ